MKKNYEILEYEIEKFSVNFVMTDSDINDGFNENDNGTGFDF